ncbi:synaptogenesis protein syg-1-like isoform X2 [Stegodyphus dumicola]|uniref:synaptogenesis protein syg-1-like isoform X2 n=1 Tax=Stegodyphus dumicola TaxID=202533 RepID=UPI0015B0C8FC|nr:synaptogenesis protein syg-1-like isoform X2 [Stegodyphus dumicola]
MSLWGLYKGIPSIVTWWRDSFLLDDSFVTMPRGVVRNELTLAYLDRRDLMSTLTCQASLPNATEPSKTSISLDLNLKPLNVHITTLQRPLSAGRWTVMKCQSSGSRPPAIITWWIGSRQLLNVSETIYDTTTISKLMYVPTADDHNRVLSCRATNPVMDGNILEDHRVLNIHYVPSLSVTVGAPHAYIMEGDIVYFDCNIDANPPATEVGWRFGDDPIYTDVNTGIKVQNRSLLLHQINRKQSGNYSCIAANSEGEGISDSVVINVQYVPYCTANQRVSYGVALRDSVDIVCEVEAFPEYVKFQWYLNNTLRQIPLKNFIVNGTVSILQYVPKRESDYGHLMCLAENGAGLQKEACCFKISPASVPSPVENCIVSNETLSSAFVSCSPGYDGGLSQEFHIELYSSKGLVATSKEKSLPEFQINELPQGTSFIAVVFATNDLGRSNAVAFSVVTKSDAVPDKDAILIPISPALGALIAVIGILVSVAVFIILCSKRWSTKLGEDVQETPAAWEEGELKPGHQHI